MIYLGVATVLVAGTVFIGTTGIGTTAMLFPFLDLGFIVMKIILEIG